MGYVRLWRGDRLGKPQRINGNLPESGIGVRQHLHKFRYQQKLMRHSQISTTMNIYGNALMDSKREANSKVAKMAMRAS